MNELRRLLGLSAKSHSKGHGGKAERHNEKTGEEQDAGARARHPELAPAPVPVSDGRISITGAALRVTLVVVGVLLALAAAHQLAGLILLVIIALIVGAAMYQPVSALEQRGLPRALALLLSYAALVGVVVLMALFIARPLVAEVERLIENAPELLDALGEQMVGMVEGVLGEQAAEDLMQTLQGSLAQIDMAGLLQLPLQLAGAIVNIFIILFLSAFFVLERDRAANWLLPLVSPDRREATRELAASVLHRLGRWVLGQLVVMTVVALAMFGGLVVLGVPFVLPLTLFAFLAEAIPMIGPWLAIVPAFAVAFTESPTTALLLAGWWFIVQQVEGYILTPAVMGRVQHLSATVVLLSVLAGFELFGVIGALIAVPVVAAVAMIVEGVLRPARRESLEGPGRQPARSVTREARTGQKT